MRKSGGGVRAGREGAEGDGERECQADRAQCGVRHGTGFHNQQIMTCAESSQTLT